MKKYFKLIIPFIIILFVQIGCVPEKAPPSIVEPPVEEEDQITQWLQENVIPVNTTQPGGEYLDLMPLKERITDAKIVALGDGTNGTHEFYTLKHRLVDFLVNELNFSLILMDGNLTEVNLINDYIQERTGNPRQLLYWVYVWQYAMEEVLEFIYWMRYHRISIDPEIQFDLQGIDTQNPMSAMYSVVGYLSGVDSLAAIKADSLYLYFRLQHKRFYHRKKTWLRELCRDNVIAVYNLVLDNQALYTSLSSEEEYARVLRLAYFVIQVEHYLATMSETVRFQNMAENIDYYLNRGGPDTKMILWSHNERIKEKNGSLVHLLQEEYGYEVATIGFSFYKGYFNAIGFDTASSSFARPCIHEVGPPPSYAYEYSMAKANTPVFILPLGYEGQPSGSEWLDKEGALRTITGMYFPSQPEMHFLPCFIRNEYDFMVFVHSTSQSTFLF
jgi:erythromycin esterase